MLVDPEETQNTSAEHVADIPEQVDEIDPQIVFVTSEENAANLVSLESTDEIAQSPNVNPVNRDSVEIVDQTLIDYFLPPTSSSLSSFLSFHPRQNTENAAVRMWLSSSSDDKLFCFVCLAFSKNDNSPFVKGFNERRHMHQRVSEHEASNSHDIATKAFFLFKSEKRIDQILFNEQLTLRKQQVENRRNVLSRIIDIVKFIGKRGLAARGSKQEAAYSLENPNEDHGNFLDLITLVCNYDSTLNEHVKKSIAESKLQKGNKRGNRVTFMSKTFLNTMTEVIGKLIQQKIVEDVKDAG